MQNKTKCFLGCGNLPTIFQIGHVPLPRDRPAGETGARGVWAPGRMLQDSGTVVYTSPAQLWVPTLYGDEDPVLVAEQLHLQNEMRPCRVRPPENMEATWAP